MKKRILSIALVIALCLTLLPAVAMAAESEELCVFVGGLKLTVAETNDETIGRDEYPYTYAWADEEGVTLAEPGEGNVILQNWYGNLYLYLYGATIPGSEEVEGGAGIYCKYPLTIELYRDNKVSGVNASGNIFAIKAENELAFTSPEGEQGTLEVSNASASVENGFAAGIYSGASISVSGTAQVTAYSGTGGYQSIGVQAVNSIGLDDSATYLEITQGFEIAATCEKEQGTIEGAGWYKTGSSATVTATAKPGYQFVNWTKDGAVVSTETAYTIAKVAETVNLTAVFETLPTEGVAVDPTETAVVEGKTKQLTASPVPEGAKLAEVTWTSSDETVATVSETGFVTGVKAGIATIIATSGEFSATCTVIVNPVVELVLPTEEGETQMKLEVETGLSEVPEELKKIETLDTPEEIETALKTVVKEANNSVTDENMAVYDVELLVSEDGGTTWKKATQENFPADGLTVTLPYPKGTNSGYAFTVVHMFTIDNGEGKRPGDTETPAVTNTADGIRFTVTGLSPLSVGWVAPTPVVTGNPTYPITIPDVENGTVTASPKNASSGAVVTLTVTPDAGFVLESLTVTDAAGNKLTLTDKSDGTYTFTMPAGKVTVNAEFAEQGAYQTCPQGRELPHLAVHRRGRRGVVPRRRALLP